MPGPTPDEIRACVVRMLALDLDLPLILAISGLSERTVWSIRKRWEEEGLFRAHKPVGVGRPRILDMGDIWYLCDRLAQDPDVFLDELQQELSEAAGIDVHISTIWRALRRLGVTRKILDKRAMERNNEERAEFRYAMRAFRPSQIVVVDETAINRRMTYRNRGYALAGDRACKRAFFVRGKRYSILPALCITGILTVLIIEGAYNTTLFLEFLELCLASMNPFPADNSVLVMDNCAIHTSGWVQEMCDERGVILVYLPPYSPNLSPIELAFAKIKTGIQRAGDEARVAFNVVGIEPGEVNIEIEAMLHHQVHSVTAEDSEAWFKHCGYIASAKPLWNQEISGERGLPLGERAFSLENMIFSGENMISGENRILRSTLEKLVTLWMSLKNMAILWRALKNNGISQRYLENTQFLQSAPENTVFS